MAKHNNKAKKAGGRNLATIGSLIPRPLPSFCCLQYNKRDESLGTRLEPSNDQYLTVLRVYVY